LWRQCVNHYRTENGRREKRKVKEKGEKKERRVTFKQWKKKELMVERLAVSDAERGREGQGDEGPLLYKLPLS